MTVLAEQIPPLTRSERAPLDRCLDTVLDAALALNRVVGAVVVVAQSGDIVYQRAVGFADRETRKPMRPNTIFRFASLAKPVVSAAAPASPLLPAESSIPIPILLAVQEWPVPHRIS
jgi:CubicO group peptidase (beta-lactamase class C family)